MTAGPSRARRLFEGWSANLVQVVLGITQQVALIPVAYTIGADFKPAARRPIEKITYWNGWKQSS